MDYLSVIARIETENASFLAFEVKRRSNLSFTDKPADIFLRVRAKKTYR